MTLLEICQKAKASRGVLVTAETEQKNKALLACADALVQNYEEILKANAVDMEHGKEKGMPAGLLDRLLLTKERIEAMALGLRQIAELPDPIGRVLESFERPNGLHIEKVSVPIGVIGIIYESRPNVTADAFALCFKSGNVVILKGGSDAIESNKAITAVLQKGLVSSGFPKDVVQLITETSREVTTEFMKQKEYVDLLIPRGGAGLIRSVVENSQIPVIETGTGNCHIYVDKDADLQKALPILVNAKTQRIGVCNAAESLVVHKDVKDAFLPMAYAALKEKNVELRGDAAAKAILPDIVDATEEDYGKEYLDLILSVKTVDSLEEAISHINRYNTGHSEAIITENPDAAQKFQKEVDAACVYVNASTRFTDGFEFGFGGEIGISTQKMHARGPMGLRELTSYKYCITGNGQVRG